MRVLLIGLDFRTFFTVPVSLREEDSIEVVFSCGSGEVFRKSGYDVFLTEDSHTFCCVVSSSDSELLHGTFCDISVILTIRGSVLKPDGSNAPRGLGIPVRSSIIRVPILPVNTDPKYIAADFSQHRHFSNSGSFLENVSTTPTLRDGFSVLKYSEAEIETPPMIMFRMVNTPVTLEATEDNTQQIALSSWEPNNDGTFTLSLTLDSGRFIISTFQSDGDDSYTEILPQWILSMQQEDSNIYTLTSDTAFEGYVTIL